jgi:hypothetical protein
LEQRDIKCREFGETAKKKRECRNLYCTASVIRMVKENEVARTCSMKGEEEK